MYVQNYLSFLSFFNSIFCYVSISLSLSMNFFSSHFTFFFRSICFLFSSSLYLCLFLSFSFVFGLVFIKSKHFAFYKVLPRYYLSPTSFSKLIISLVFYICALFRSYNLQTISKISCMYNITKKHENKKF